jgi:hypothetical protein
MGGRVGSTTYSKNQTRFSSFPHYQTLNIAIAIN